MLAATEELFVEEYGDDLGEPLYLAYARAFGRSADGWANSRENIRQNVVQWVAIKFAIGNAGSRQRRVSAGADKPLGKGSWVDAGVVDVATAILHTGSLFYLRTTVTPVAEAIDGGPSRSVVFRESQRVEISPIDATAARVTQ
jgi:hypothetical protein